MELQLTDREHLIFEQIALGLSEHAIANKVGRSYHTIHNQAKTIRKKIGANSVGDVVRIFCMNLKEHPKEYFDKLMTLTGLSLVLYIL